MKRRFWIASKVNKISIVGIVAISAFLVRIVTFASKEDYVALLSDIRCFCRNDTLQAVAFLSILGLFEIFMILTRFETFGRVIITDTELIMRAPLRKPRRMQLREIKYLGIDYARYSGSTHFWIYFSKAPLKSKYTHRINLAPTASPDMMKIEFNQGLFDFLVAELPNNLSKTLSASYSVIRLFEN